MRPSRAYERGLPDEVIYWDTKVGVRYRQDSVGLKTLPDSYTTLTRQEAFDVGRALIEASGFDPKTYGWSNS